jgi:hypothetical protein
MATNPKAPAAKLPTALSTAPAITYAAYEFSAYGVGDHPVKTSQESQQEAPLFRHHGLQVQIQISIQSGCLFLHPAVYPP